jgi:hypothetical protein
MREYRRRLIEKALEGLFSDERNKHAVVDWWAASNGRRPVILVGAGFTQNAVWTSTKKPVADGVALWKELRSRLESDLRIGSGKYDVLTLADLYSCRFGEGHLQEVFLRMVPDEKLEPGDAHRALLNYDAEAIITTNHLDTLLDRGHVNWCPVINDHDVATHDPENEKRQIIYVHGHRSDVSTWVATRSQYEELDTAHPVIVARVRQLLAQHPLLAVGYSLTDPDFHLLYRRISRDMRQRHPRGLAILTDVPDSATEEYWRRLGLLVATLAPRDRDQSFKKFFESARPRVPCSRLVALFKASEDTTSRLAIFKDYLTDKDRTDFVVSSPAEDEQNLWEAVKSTLPPSRIKDASERAARAREVGAKVARGAIDNELADRGTETPQTARFPSHRFPERERVEFLDQIADYEGSWKGLAEWSRFLFDTPALRTWAEEHSWQDLPSLVSWIWTKHVLENQGNRIEALRLIREALAYADRYRLKDMRDSIRKDLEDLGEASDSPTADTSQLTPARADMDRAFRLALDGRWQEAHDAYKDAFRTVGSAYPLLKWLAAEGRWWTAERWQREARFGQAAGPPDQLIEECDRQAKQAEGHPDVRLWKDRADRQRAEIVDKTTDRLREELSSAGYETRSFSWSNLPHFVWRSWRDLSDLSAPPGIQRRYLEPLLDYQCLGNDADSVSEELHVRLQLELKRTQEWVARLLDDASPSLTEAASTAAALMSTAQKCAQESKTEKLGVLMLVPALAQIARVEDLDWIEKFVIGAYDALGVAVETAGGTAFTFRDEAAAWHALASVERGEVVLGLLIRCKTNGHPIFRGELQRGLGRAPWRHWLLTGANTDEWMRFLEKEARESLDSKWTAGRLGILEAAARLLTNATKMGRQVDSGMLDSWTLFCERMLDAKHETWIRPGVIQGVIEVGSGLIQQRAGSAEGLVDRALALAFNDQAAADDVANTGFSPVEARLRAVAACLENGHRLDVTMSRAEVLLAELKTKWPAVERHCRLNPRDVPLVTWFLVQVLPHLGGSDTGWLLDTIVKLLATTSLALPTVVPIAQAALWDATRWGEFVNTIRIGGPQRAKRSWLIAQIGLLRGLSAAAVAAQQTAVLPAGLEYLPDLALCAVDEPDGLIANHVGYALAAWIELAENDQRITPAVAALERFATDPRIAVRHAAAYGVASLKNLARETWVRDRMAAIYEKLSSDPTIRVRLQLEVGAAEARIRSA